EASTAHCSLLESADLARLWSYAAPFSSVTCLCHLTHNTRSAAQEWVLRVGYKRLSGAAYERSPVLAYRGPDARATAASAQRGDPVGSVAARAAVHRTCHEVTLRCQRVLARYRPDEDKLKHVAVGDPDPGPAHGYRTW